MVRGRVLYGYLKLGGIYPDALLWIGCGSVSHFL